MIKEQELAVVYYMPKTELAFTFEYDQIIRTAGPYAAYAKELLGIENAVMENDTTYRLRGIRASVRTSADTDRAYKVVADGTLNTQLIALNEQGVLQGYNIPAMPHISKDMKGDKPKRAEGMQPKPHPLKGMVERPMVIPFQEGDMKVSAGKERAKKIVAQIFQIRETRMFILAGEVDHAPADGKAMERVLDELHEQEQYLVSLFAGRVDVVPMEKRMYYLPTQSEQVVLTNFNSETGFGTGESVMLTIAATKQVKGAMSESTKKSKKAPQPSQIFYNLPGQVHYSLIYKDKKWIEREVDIPQLGVAVPLTTELFKDGVHIVFNDKTGNIRSIEN